MITITQNKVAGFEPRWASFARFSLLFDNPGKPLVQKEDGGLPKICVSPVKDEEGDLAFYFGIEKALEKIGRDLVIQTYHFCPLPTSSYHVTVWDGINNDNISSVKLDVRSEWSAFLEGLPNSLSAPPALMNVIKGSNLMQWNEKISFQFEKLMLWGNQVLVARLRPADTSSKQNIEELIRHRADLSNIAEQKFRVPFSQSYAPHISLGYFANQEYAYLAHGRIEQWKENFMAELTDSVITYTSLDIYGFTDMASFYKTK